MTDRSINDLCARRHAHDPDENDGRQGYDTARQHWWEEFVVALGQNVWVWNEKMSCGEPVNFTRKPGGRAHIWHRNAEVEFRQDSDAVLAKARVGDGSVDEHLLIELQRVGETVTATSDGEMLSSPAAAAERMVTGVVTALFQFRARPSGAAHITVLKPNGDMNHESTCGGDRRRTRS